MAKTVLTNKCNLMGKLKGQTWDLNLMLVENASEKKGERNSPTDPR